MREIYIILGWIGWVWLVVSMLLIGAGLMVQRARRRNGVRGVEFDGKNTKQS
jgi:hypothetical protein